MWSVNHKAICDPCDANENLFHAAKEKLELFYEEKSKGIIMRGLAGANIARRAQTWRREITQSSICEN